MALNSDDNFENLEVYSRPKRFQIANTAGAKMASSVHCENVMTIYWYDVLPHATLSLVVGMDGLGKPVREPNGRPFDRLGCDVRNGERVQS
jgi:hypothetical protein